MLSALWGNFVVYFWVKFLDFVLISANEQTSDVVFRFDKNFHTDNAKIYGSIHGTVSVIGNAVVPKYIDISSDNKILIIKSNDNNETVIG